MPYDREWIENERAFSFMDIPVYHAYKDDEADERLDYWFHVSADATCDEAFDARDLPFAEDVDKELLVSGIADMQREYITSVHRRVASALWSGLLVPPRYSERFVLAKICELLRTPSEFPGDLRNQLREMFSDYNVVPSKGQCEFLADEDVGLRVEEN
jgi:hypothetical protein